MRKWGGRVEIGKLFPSLFLLVLMAKVREEEEVCYGFLLFLSFCQRALSVLLRLSVRDPYIALDFFSVCLSVRLSISSQEDRQFDRS